MASFVTPHFVGREGELTQLEDTLRSTAAGTGRCVLVRGDAGIGKSRLIAEIRARAVGRGFTALTGRSFAQDRTFPYAPFVDMLRPLLTGDTVHDLLDPLGALAQPLLRLLPELAALSPVAPPAAVGEPEGEKRRLFAALTALFLHQAGTGPLLIVVEDLHWSDEASLEFLLYLVRRIGAHPVFLLLTARDPGAHGGLVELLSWLDREPIAGEIGLAPLTRPELARLLNAILAQTQLLSAEFVDAIYTLTEGNPFFAEEICTSLIATGDLFFANNQWRRKPLSQIEIPGSIQRVVQRRLDRISPPARELIDLAAVSGRSFDLAVLQDLTGHDDTALLALVKELIAARLLVEESAEQDAFRHALTREALYSRLLARERQALHGRLVAAIERVHAGPLEAHLEALAYHAYEAALWPKALDYARRAGEKAQALYAPHAAVQQFTRALHAASRLAVAPGATLYRLRGQAYDTLGDFDRAREDYEQALVAARSAANEQAAWRALLDLGLLWAARDYQRTGEYCRQALELARAMASPPAIAHSLNRLGNWLMNSGEPVAALDYHRQALAIFEPLGDQAGVAATLDLLAMTTNMCGDFVGTVGYYRQAIPILRALNDRATLASSLTMLSNYTLDETLVREALSLARAIDWRAGEAFALVYLGSLLAYRGDYGAGLSAAQRGLELAQAIGHRQWQAWGEAILGLLTLELLALDDAHRHLKRSRSLAVEVGSGFMISFATGLLASTLIRQERHDEAAALLPARQPPSVMAADVLVLQAMAELRLAHHDPLGTLQLLDRMELPARQDWLGAMVYFYGAILQLQAEALLPLARHHEAEAALRSVLDLCQQAGTRMGLWRVQLALGRVYQAMADPGRAATAFAASRALVAELGATLPDEGLRAHFQREALAQIPPSRPLTARQALKAEFSGLTRREREVAAVVAQGLSNQEIAGALVISVKTVEAHITRILSKLDFSSRAQLAAWAVDKGLAAAPQPPDDR